MKYSMMHWLRSICFALIMAAVCSIVLIAIGWPFYYLWGDTGVMILCGSYVIGLYCFLQGSNLKERRPDESWKEARRRLSRELIEWSAENKRRTRYDRYRYVRLSCEHVIHEYFTEAQGFPVSGDLFWCPKHRRFGPAEKSYVKAVYDFPPELILKSTR